MLTTSTTSYLIHVLNLSVLVGLRGLAVVPALSLVLFVFTLNLHLHLLALAVLFVALLDQDTSAELLWCGWWWEVTWGRRTDGWKFRLFRCGNI